MTHGRVSLSSRPSRHWRVHSLPDGDLRGVQHARGRRQPLPRLPEGAGRRTVAGQGGNAGSVLGALAVLGLAGLIVFIAGMLGQGWLAPEWRTVNNHG